MTARKKGSLAASKVIRQRAVDSYSDLAPRIAELRKTGKSLRQIADAINDDGHTTRRGRPWNPMQVQRVLARS